jgi:type II restriction/modification system DNA methylase subunit YeeA
MNTGTLKSYAPKARKDFLNSVTDKAALLGITAKEQIPANITGDTAVINGRPYSAQIGKQQIELVERVKKEGFQQVMEAIAYSWFNRFMAIRFMEIHDYLEHGYRVLSHPAGHDEPEILEKATSVELSGLNKQKVAELKLDGGKDEELYQVLLKAQCNELNKSMPFLFEHVADCTELLMPENLLHSDSVIREMVNTIDEDDWQEIEIIGWLYQFYISEKKDQVIGKVVKSEDIPAATQLFTPRWIVEYMVQNSLGRTWLNYKPESPLKTKMDYYIEPAEQSDEVNKQLAELVAEELNPEDLTLIDPACGSGHILVVAYDVLFQIYKETGRKSRNIPRLILEKNLFGLDIDQRAVQLSTFALLMKARKDDSRILNREGLKLNIHEIPESSDLNADEIHNYLFHSDDSEYKTTIQDLINTFQYGKTYGSLITIDQNLYCRLTEMQTSIVDKGTSGDGLEIIAKKTILPFVEVGLVLGKKYDAVVANPPYMGTKGMNAIIKDYSKIKFKDSKSDLFAMFMEQGFYFAKENGYNSQINMQSWMFLGSYQKLRRKILNNKSLITMAHLGARAFGQISGEVVQTTVFCILNTNIVNIKPVFFRLTEGNEESKKNALKAKEKRYSLLHQSDFLKMSTSPIAYWINKKIISLYSELASLYEVAPTNKGLDTGHNDTFLRFWFEVDINKTALFKTSDDSPKWVPCQKGGSSRSWYGNNEIIVNWENKGEKLKKHSGSTIRNERNYFLPGLSWSTLSTSKFRMRHVDQGFIFESKGAMCFPNEEDSLYILALCNSTPFNFLLALETPTLDYHEGPVGRVPVVKKNNSFNDKNIENLVCIAKKDWDSFETSWSFKEFPWLFGELKAENTILSNDNWESQCQTHIQTMKELEEDNNRLFIKAYGLEGELTADVPEEQITLARADKVVDTKKLISYAIGCMMGRFSLDQQGLVYAHSGNKDFNETVYSTFPADDDGILPLLDMDWEFEDDITLRFEEFLRVVWDEKTLFENMEFVAGAFNTKQNETPKDAIRRYLSSKFFDDHLKTYKKRPIYWLVSSGKEKAFEALIYLHRYNEATLARMRNDYVIPLQGKMNKRSAYLEDQVKQGGSASLIRQYQKEVDTIKKKQLELAKFDDLLKHYADQKISLDLDDGVKVNYGKFSTLLAKVKEITGKKPEELN